MHESACINRNCQSGSSTSEVAAYKLPRIAPALGSAGPGAVYYYTDHTWIFNNGLGISRTPDVCDK